MTHISDFELDEYLDGTLPEESRVRVQEHLTICDNCQQKAMSQQALFNVMQSGRIEPMPVDLAPIVIARIRRDVLPVPARLLLTAQVLGAILLCMWLTPMLAAWGGVIQSFTPPLLAFPDLAAVPDLLHIWQTAVNISAGQLGGLGLGVTDWVVLIAIGGILWLVANRLLLNNLFRIVKNSPEASS